MKLLVCYTAVFSVVTQWGRALRDDTKNGCVADYEIVAPSLVMTLEPYTTIYTVGYKLETFRFKDEDDFEYEI